METTYERQPLSPRSTRMILRNRGNPSGFAQVGASVMGAAMRRANRRDLADLKRILETRSAG
jgi:hypothetical protein